MCFAASQVSLKVLVWLSLLTVDQSTESSALGIPTDHSVCKELQTAVSNRVLLPYSHGTLAASVTFLGKPLHTLAAVVFVLNGGRAVRVTQQVLHKWSKMGVRASLLAFRNALLVGNAAVDGCWRCESTEGQQRVIAQVTVRVNRESTTDSAAI